VKALILAAGFGTRMAPITDSIPKPLIPVLNRPTIEYNIYFLKHYGIKEIYINLHSHGEKIAKALGNGSRYGVTIEYLPESEILGTGGAIANVLGQMLKGITLKDESRIKKAAPRDKAGMPCDDALFDGNAAQTAISVSCITSSASSDGKRSRMYASIIGR